MAGHARATSLPPFQVYVSAPGGNYRPTPGRGRPGQTHFTLFSYQCYADDTQLYLSFPPDDHTVSAQISDCLSDISKWKKGHHLQLNLSKTELLVFPAKLTIHQSICIQTESLTLAPSKVARNLGVMIDDQLTFKDHVLDRAASHNLTLERSGHIQPNTPPSSWCSL